MKLQITKSELSVVSRPLKKRKVGRFTDWNTTDGFLRWWKAGRTSKLHKLMAKPVEVKPVVAVSTKRLSDDEWKKLTNDQRNGILAARKQKAIGRATKQQLTSKGPITKLYMWKRRTRRPMKRKRWKPKPPDAQVQLVLMKGRRMRQISKADGRKIYRPPRKQQIKGWWKLRHQKKFKKRKSDKARVGFRHIARAHNDLELRILRKRRLFTRAKRFYDYADFKLNTPHHMMTRYNRAGSQIGARSDVLANRLSASTSLRTTSAWQARGRVLALTDGYVSADPWATGHNVVRSLKVARQRHARTWKLPSTQGNRLQQLIWQRRNKNTSLIAKSPTWAMTTERLAASWHHGRKHK